MRVKVTFVVGAALVVVFGWPRPRGPVFVPAAHATDPAHDEHAVPEWARRFHTDHSRPAPHGSLRCASGCAANSHPTPLLLPAHFEGLIARYASETPDTLAPALDELVYYGAQSKAMLAEMGPGPLDADHARFLEDALARNCALVEIRVVDASGRHRITVPPTVVALDIRFAFTPDLDGLPRPLEMSGTVKRVGRSSVWQRL